MNKLSERVRNLHPGYQGLDDKAQIASALEILESRLEWLTDMVKSAAPLVRKAQVHSRSYGGSPPTIIEEWLEEFGKYERGELR
jgi:hypothetical protein